MAFLYDRKDSRFLWVNFVDPEDGVRKSKSTGYIRSDPSQLKKARAIEAKKGAAEHENNTHSENERWEDWVGPFLERHCASPLTLSRYQLAWSWLGMYLRERSIRIPSQLTYQDCLGYLRWRVEYKKRGGRTVKLNTALNDIKVLRLLVRQATRLQYCTGNVCDRLGVPKEDAKEKPDLTDDDIQAIRLALKDQPGWMRDCFEISINTGCRLSETSIEFRHIDFNRKTITFNNPKGGKARAFTAPLPDSLIGRLKTIKESGAVKTVELPKMPGKAWWQFFKHELKRPELCFHCCRVTYVTRLARAGVPLSAAMRLVNHSSTLVHKIYQRLGVDDVRQWAAAVAIPDSQ